MDVPLKRMSIYLCVCRPYRCEAQVQPAHLLPPALGRHHADENYTHSDPTLSQLKGQLPKMDAEELYLRLGHHVADAPDLVTPPFPPEVHQWVGRATALVEASGDLADRILMRELAEQWTIGTLADQDLDRARRRSASQKMMMILIRQLANLELKAPDHVREKFIPAGGAFTAFEAVTRAIKPAQDDLLIIDPYMNDTALSFALAARPGVPIRLLARENKTLLVRAAEAWAKEHAGSRPLQIRLGDKMHDRVIITDHRVAWTLTQSLNAFATKSPATVIRWDTATAALKVETYQRTWEDAKIIFE